jgi:hypothetical protein
MFTMMNGILANYLQNRDEIKICHSKFVIIVCLCRSNLSHCSCLVSLGTGKDDGHMKGSNQVLARVRIKRS